MKVYRILTEAYVVAENLVEATEMLSDLSELPQDKQVVIDELVFEKTVQFMNSEGVTKAALPAFLKIMGVAEDKIQQCIDAIYHYKHEQEVLYQAIQIPPVTMALPGQDDPDSDPDF